VNDGTERKSRLYCVFTSFLYIFEKRNIAIKVKEIPFRCLYIKRFLINIYIQRILLFFDGSKGRRAIANLYPVSYSA